MKLAAIDIGSNAVRLQITQIIIHNNETTFKKLQYIRYPLRLGEDVFTYKKIRLEKEKNFMKLMQSFKLLIDLYEVDDYFACATSAMREAGNGQQIADKIFDECNLKVNIISGSEEAEMINRVISFYLSEEYNCLHIDVGGGSTELNLYKNKSIIASKSFPIGSVRLLNNQVKQTAWDSMKSWISENLSDSKEEIMAIGTGGNINKLFDLAKGIKGTHLSIKKIQLVKKILDSMTLKERIHNLKLNADRADVIIPASEIYLFVMNQANANKILVPDVGLKDGIMTYLYESNVIKNSNYKFNN